MARKYVRVIVEMIADMVPGTGQLIKDDVAQLIHGMEALDAGEVSVTVEAHGEVQVNQHGYAVSWVE
jgi:hypothetical protein